MTFEELQTQLDNDLNISDENIAEKSLCLARIYQKYLKLLTSEKLKNDKIEIVRKELYGKLFHDLIKNGHEGFDVGKQRNSIEPYIFMNESYRKLESQTITNEHFIEHLEMALKNISTVSFNIKNNIDARKLKLGLT